MYRGLQWVPTAQTLSGCLPSSYDRHKHHQWHYNSHNSERYTNQWSYNNINECITGSELHSRLLAPADVTSAPLQQTWSAAGSNDATLGSTPPLPELGGEELFFEDETATEDLCEEVQDTSVFPCNFFANPFAVSFPGDIQCPGALTMHFSLDMDDTAVALTPSVTQQPPPAIAVDAPVASAPPTTSLSPELPTESIKTPDGQFHFIDMADKKAAMRIRNTRISRQHKQNKIKRIAELERQLEAALTRVEQLEKGKK